CLRDTPCPQTGSDGERQSLRRKAVCRIRDHLAPETGLISDALEPFREISASRKIERRVCGNVTVGKYGNVRDRVCIAGDKRPFAELSIQNVKRAVSKSLRRRNVSRELAKLAGQRPIPQPAD